MKVSLIRQNLKNQTPSVVHQPMKSILKLHDTSDVISISEFSIAPSAQTRYTTSNENSRGKVKTLKLGPIKKFNSIKQLLQKDEHMRQYMLETKNARDERSKFKLPPIPHLTHTSRPNTKWNQLYNSLFYKFKNIEEFEEGPKYEPTYQLEPNVKFSSRKAQPLIQNLLNGFLDIINVQQVMSSQSSIKSAMDHLCTQG